MPNLSQLRKLKPYLAAPYNDVDEPQVGTVAPQVLKRLQDIVSTPQEQPVVSQPEMAAPLTRLPTIDMQNQGVAANSEATRLRRVTPNVDTVDLGGGSTYTPIKFDPNQAQGINETPRERVVDPISFETRKLADMTTAPPAKSHHNRAYQTGLEAWRGFQNNGLLGALFGAGKGLISPDSVQQETQQGDIGRQQGKLERLVGAQQATQALDTQAATNDWRRSEAWKNTHPNVTPYHVTVPGEGTFEATPGQGQGRRVEGIPAGERPALRRTAPHYETREDGTYVVDEKSPEGRKLGGIPGKPKPRMLETVLSDGTKVMLTDAERASYDAGVSGRDETARQHAEQTAKENSKINYDNIKQEWGEAQKYVQGLNDTIMALGDAQRTIQTLGPILDKTPEGSRNAKDVTALATAYADRARLEQEMSAKGEFLANNYGEHIVRRADGTYALKPAPAREPLPTRPLRGRNYVAPKVSRGELNRLMSP